MAEITAAQVKTLREKTGAGMMDCKKALVETAGDLEGAVDWLRKKGLAAAAKKAGRVAAEGLIGVTTAGKRGAIVEVNAETDFVARNETFQEFVRAAAAAALETGDDVGRLKAAPYSGGGSVEERLTHLVATIGENMNLRRAAVLSVGQGVVASYIHSAVAPGAPLGKIGVLVALESSADPARLQALGKQLAMHVAAAKPESLDIASVDARALARERDVLTDQAKNDPKNAGKPDAIIGKMIDGRLNKYYENVVLLEQVYAVDGESRVKAVIEKAGKELGAPVKVAGFVRFALGEGIERKENDFAAEVAAQAQLTN